MVKMCDTQETYYLHSNTDRHGCDCGQSSDFCIVLFLSGSGIPTSSDHLDKSCAVRRQKERAGNSKTGGFVEGRVSWS